MKGNRALPIEPGDCCVAGARNFHNWDHFFACGSQSPLYGDIPSVSEVEDSVLTPLAVDGFGQYAD
jgi:hypothetical protein